MGVGGFIRNRLGTIALLAGAHFVLAFVCLVVGMGDWSDQATEPAAIERMAWGAATVLSAPARWLWTSWASKNLHDVVEWGLVIANSLLWGTACAALWSAWRRRNQTGS